MSARYRGSSPTHAHKVVSEEAKLANQQAQQAFKRRNARNSGFFTQYAYHLVVGSFVGLVVLAFVFTYSAKSSNPETTHVIEEDLVNSHNSQKHSFTLGSNDHFNEWFIKDAKEALNVQLSSKQQMATCVFDNSAMIPDSYNFREAYPKCKSQITAQGKCASSYALQAASAISDRLCKASKGETVVELSAQPLISCDSTYSLKCKGGYLSRSFDYAKKSGLPETSCMAYNGKDTADCATMESCTKHKIQGQCYVKSEENIKREIFENGPVVAVMQVYRDFLVYKKGIYRVLPGVASLRTGGQAVKIVGWGVDENNQNFWIVENTWGTSWGEQGTARVYTSQIEELQLDGAIAPIVNTSTTTTTTTETA